MTCSRFETKLVSSWFARGSNLRVYSKFWNVNFSDKESFSGNLELLHLRLNKIIISWKIGKLDYWSASMVTFIFKLSGAGMVPSKLYVSVLTFDW